MCWLSSKHEQNLSADYIPTLVLAYSPTSLESRISVFGIRGGSRQVVNMHRRVHRPAIENICLRLSSYVWPFVAKTFPLLLHRTTAEPRVKWRPCIHTYLHTYCCTTPISSFPAGADGGLFRLVLSCLSITCRETCMTGLGWYMRTYILLWVFFA